LFSQHLLCRWGEIVHGPLKPGDRTPLPLWPIEIRATVRGVILVIQIAEPLQSPRFISAQMAGELEEVTGWKRAVPAKRSKPKKVALGRRHALTGTVTLISEAASRGLLISIHARGGYAIAGNPQRSP